MATRLDYDSRSLMKRHGAPLKGLLADRSVGLEDVAAWLEEATPEVRIHACRALGGAAQRRLWELSEGRLVRADDMVPVSLAPGRTVRHHGRNSLPAFRLFEKRFARVAAGGELHGYNHQAMASFTGPGYFVAGSDASRDTLVIDYRRVPTERREGWPAIRDNVGGVAGLVYGDMVDVMRRVCEGVTIGRAVKHGRTTSNTFVLCREPLQH